MRLVIFQPDIPQNLRASVRNISYLGMGVHIVETFALALSGHFDGGRGLQIDRWISI